MVKCFANDEYRITADNLQAFQDKLIGHTVAFREEYAYVFNVKESEQIKPE